jgi:hypothetical protein
MIATRLALTLCPPVRRGYTRVPSMAGRRHATVRIAAITVLVLALSCMPAQAAPEGQMTWAVHLTVMPLAYEDLTLKAR